MPTCWKPKLTGSDSTSAGSQDRVSGPVVEVADTAAGEAGGTGAGPLLIDQDNIAALALAAPLSAMARW